MTDNALRRLQELLSKLFQLEHADLDFGIYRLFRIKRDELKAFIEAQLPRSVDEAFGAAAADERAAAAEELANLEQELRAEFGSDDIFAPDGALLDELRNTPGRTVQDLIAAYDQACAAVQGMVESEAHRVEVFNHLHAFFSRYYDDGDFVPHRRYGAHEHYAVPYNGEETYFHWANRGQHYVKSAETLRDYAFTVEGDLVTAPRRVRFVLTAASVPPGDNKGDARYFFPQQDDVAWDGESSTVTIPFEYRRPTAAETERYGRQLQDGFLDDAIGALLATLPEEADLRAALAKPISDEEDAPSLLLRHIRKFVRRSTSDYFVHGDLKGFLTRELEFYVKDQILHLADLDGDLAARTRTIRVFRRVATDVTEFLAQIEDVQKRLFEKRKFVLRTDYLVLLKEIPQEMWREVVANERQLAAWEELFKVSRKDVATRSGRPRMAFLNERPTLVVDTSLFDNDFRDRIIEHFDDLDDAIGGVLIHSENYQALRLIQPKYEGRIKCIYIDPPYNTGGGDFAYKDAFQHSSWLAMMSERIAGGRALLSRDGVIFVSIDEKELPRLRILLDEEFGKHNRVGDVIWKNATDNNPTRIAQEHEYILAYAREKAATRSDWKSKFTIAKDLLQAEYERLRSEFGADIRGIERSIRRFINDNAPVIGKLRRYKFVDDQGLFAGSESVHNPHPGGYDYEIYHPSTGQPMRKPVHGYRFPYATMKRDFIDAGRLIYGPDENRIVKIKIYLADYVDAFRSVVELDGRLGAYALRELFGRGTRVFRNPKPVQLVEQLASFSAHGGGTVLDFTGGSGTTAHAVMKLDTSTDQRFDFVVVEMASHFDTVLAPRVTKLMATHEWTDGHPNFPDAPSRTRSLTKLVRLESYEDALHNLASEETRAREAHRVESHKKRLGDDAYRLRYLARLPLEASASMLSLEKLEHPFNYTLETVTEEGPVEHRVDLVETFNLAAGLHVERLTWWTNEADGGRRYRVVRARDRDERRVLVLWRDMDGLDAALERAFLDDCLAALDPRPDRILINGDSGHPDVESLDPLFKRLIEEEEERP